jgi:hypothetical protein
MYSPGPPRGACSRLGNGSSSPPGHLLGTNRANGVLIFLRDNQELIREAQQFKLASLGTLTASIAHNVRNPLSAIATRASSWASPRPWATTTATWWRSSAANSAPHRRDHPERPAALEAQSGGAPASGPGALAPGPVRGVSGGPRARGGDPPAQDQATDHPGGGGPPASPSDRRQSLRERPAPRRRPGPHPGPGGRRRGGDKAVLEVRDEGPGIEGGDGP